MKVDRARHPKIEDNFKKLNFVQNTLVFKERKKKISTYCKSVLGPYFDIRSRKSI